MTTSLLHMRYKACLFGDSAVFFWRREKGSLVTLIVIGLPFMQTSAYRLMHAKPEALHCDMLALGCLPFPKASSVSSFRSARKMADVLGIRMLRMESP